jgi:hypothetical protein
MQLKKLSLFALSAVSAFLLISTGCKKSNNGNSAAVSATIAGTSFNPSFTGAVYFKSNQYFDLGGYSVTGKDTAFLDISINTPFTVNKVLDNNTLVTINYITGGKDYLTGYQVGTAALTVTSLDSVNHKIAGTFTGTLYTYGGSNDSVIVSNGRFNTAYTVQ